MFGFRKIWQELQEHGRRIATINDEMGVVQEQTKDLPAMRSDVKWLKWLVCAIALMVIASVLKLFLGI